MDEIIKIVKNMLEEWAQYYAEWDAWMGEINDDWSNYQEVMNEAWQDMQDFINNYFDNLDVQEEINNKITEMVATGEFATIVNPYVPPAVTEWLTAHITQPEGVVIDTSLSVSGACADAKATGDAIGNILNGFQQIAGKFILTTGTYQADGKTTENLLRRMRNCYPFVANTVNVITVTYPYKIRWFALDGDYNIISEEPTWLDMIDVTTLPANTVFFNFTIENFEHPQSDISSELQTALAGMTITMKTDEEIKKIDINLNTRDFINKPTPKYIKSTLQSDGGIYTNNAYGANLAVTDFLLVEVLEGYQIRNAMSWTGANAYSIAFYNDAKQTIGTAYADTDTTSKTNITVDVDTLLPSYPDAVYMRIAYDTNEDFKVVKLPVEETLDTIYPTYKVNAYPSIIFCGDSVTAGFVVEGTENDPSQIYGEEPEYSYPSSFNRIYAGANVTTVAQSGISVKGFYDTKYPQIDFSDYNMCVFELGLNPGNEGYLNINDWNTPGTNTNIYRQMIAGVRTQNADIKIVLVRTQIYQNDALAVLQAIATESDCLVIDLMDKKYINLNDTKYHGYYNNGGVATLDPTHFNRIGYTAKAYDVTRWLGELLP